MKCMNVKGLEAYQGKKFLKKLEESLKNKVWSEMRVFQERKQKSIEREIEGNDFRIAQGAYIVQPVNLDKCSYQEVSRYLSRRRRGNALRQLRCRRGIEEQRNKIKNRSSIDPPGIEVLSRIQTQSRSIHQVLRCWRDCDKKKLRKLDRQLAIEEVLASFSKQFFERRKTQT